MNKRSFDVTKTFAATHCNTLQHTATHCKTLHHPAKICNALQHTATHCNTLQHPAKHHITVQHTGGSGLLMKMQGNIYFTKTRTRSGFRDNTNASLGSDASHEACFCLLQCSAVCCSRFLFVTMRCCVLQSCALSP